MTLAIKLAIIAALILSIFIPFGYFLHGERTKKRYKRSIAFNAFFFFGIIVIAGVMMFVTALIEMGFMTNKTEDKQMQKKQTQKKMVDGIANGIDQYFK